MPLYEYRCRDCGHQFEIQQTLSDEALTECPSCAGDLRKVFSPVGIAFKGSGFYKTDSRSSSGSNGGSSGGDGGSDTSSGGSESSSSSASDSSGTSTSSTKGDGASSTPSTTSGT